MFYSLLNSVIIPKFHEGSTSLDWVQQNFLFQTQDYLELVQLPPCHHSLLLVSFQPHKWVYFPFFLGWRFAIQGLMIFCVLFDTLSLSKRCSNKKWLPPCFNYSRFSCSLFTLTYLHRNLWVVFNNVVLLMYKLQAPVQPGQSGAVIPSVVESELRTWVASAFTSCLVFIMFDLSGSSVSGKIGYITIHCAKKIYEIMWSMVYILGATLCVQAVCEIC